MTDVTLDRSKIPLGANVLSLQPRRNIRPESFSQTLVELGRELFGHGKGTWPYFCDPCAFSWLTPVEKYSLTLLNFVKEILQKNQPEIFYFSRISRSQKTTVHVEATHWMRRNNKYHEPN